MSELPAGSVSLEDEPTLPPEPEPVADAAPVAAPAEPTDPDPEGVIVNPAGEKLVPLSALVAERQAKQQAKQEASQYREKAQKVDQVVAEWTAAQPLIQQALQQRQAPQAPEPKGPLTDQEAMEYARDLDLYKPDGTPDVDRAQRLAARNEAMAERRAQALVAPLHQQTAVAQSNANLATAIAHAEKNKIGVDRATIERVWGIVPPEASAKPEVAGVLWRMALAEAVMAGQYRAPVEAPPPPVMTESATAPTSKTSHNSALDRAFREAAGLTEKRFVEIADKYEPGRANSLE